MGKDRQPIFEAQLERTEQRKRDREAEEELLRNYIDKRSIPKKVKTKGKNAKKGGKRKDATEDSGAKDDKHAKDGKDKKKHKEGDEHGGKDEKHGKDGDDHGMKESTRMKSMLRRIRKRTLRRS